MKNASLSDKSLGCKSITKTKTETKKDGYLSGKGLAIICATAIYTSSAVAGSVTESNSSVSHYYVDEQSFQYNSGAYAIKKAKGMTVMRYWMPGIQGKLVIANALILFPKTAIPKAGWRVVLWAHGTLGVADACAPSRNRFSDDRFTAMADQLLARGYVIVAPDYEGLGAAEIHPYLQLKSEANSAIYAIKALKQHYATFIQGEWMAVGQSQGGHAVLGIAQYAKADPFYKGTVAGAPASGFGQIITTMIPATVEKLWHSGRRDEAVAVYATLLAYTAYIGAGIKAEQPQFDERQLFSARAAPIAALAFDKNQQGGLCLVDDPINLHQGLVNRFAKDIQRFLKQHPDQTILQYAGINTTVFDLNTLIKQFIDQNQPANHQLETPLMVIQGTADTSVPYVLTQALVDRQLHLGASVDFVPVEGASHTEAIVSKRAALIKFIEDHMPAGVH